MPINTASVGCFPYLPQKPSRRTLGTLLLAFAAAVIRKDSTWFTGWNFMSKNSTMMLDIMRNGLVHRLEDGSVTILRPGRNGGPGEEIEVERGLADAYGLASGDIVEG